MSDSMFDPNTLLDTEYTGDLNTRLTPIPEGAYLGRIKSVAVRSGVKDGTRWASADVNFIIDDEEVKEATSLNEPTARMSLFLDLVPGTNRLATAEDNPNANVRLGRLKEACGVKSGRKWSLRHLEGMQCYVRVKQRADDNDPETIYSDVVAVSSEMFAEKPRRAA